MTLPHPLSEILTTHSPLISALSNFYQALIDLDYLLESEVQFPPHQIEEGRTKLPLATTALQSSNLTSEAHNLLSLLPYILPTSISKLFQGESRITLLGKPLSYLIEGEGEDDEHSLDDERSLGCDDDGEVMLPGWAVQIFGASNSSENIVIYDTQISMGDFPSSLFGGSRLLTLLSPGKLSELSIYQPTSHELLAAATSPEALIGTWTRNLLTLAWIPWRNDDDLYGMQTLDEEEESRLADPEKWRQELIATTGPTTLNDLDGYVNVSPLTSSTINELLTPISSRNPVGTLPTAEQRFTYDMQSARENHNQYWAKRLVYESAGRPDALDKEVLRARIRDFERERFEARDNARPDGSKEDEAENEFYRRAAGAHGV
jgi:hypothetical protein